MRAFQFSKKKPPSASGDNTHPLTASTQLNANKEVPLGSPNKGLEQDGSRNLSGLPSNTMLSNTNLLSDPASFQTACKLLHF
jgi:hypothetical protein